MSVVETIKGKTQGLLLMRNQDSKTDLMVKKTVNEISGLIDSFDLSREQDLLDRVAGTLMRLKKSGMAASFLRKHKKR